MGYNPNLIKAAHRRGTRLIAAALSVTALSACTVPKVKADNPAIADQVSTIVSANGSVITSVPTDVIRIPISYASLGKYLPVATVAIEDKRYWIRGPIDIRSIVRAALANVAAGSVEQGGSTIEEQLVKLELGTPKRTLAEKLHEILLSLGSLTGTTKAKVLDAYLNDVYLGEGTYGAEAASLRYFGKPAADLDLYQAATIAGLINAPSAYDPLLHPDLAIERRNEVLAAMYSQGEITLAAYQRASRVGLELSTSPASVTPTMGYFSQAVLAQAETLPALGATLADRIRLIEHGGLKIVSTEVPADQVAARNALDSSIPKLARQPTGALVSIDPANGAVQALVGGLGFGSGAPASQFNMATQAQRPAGSTFKIIALAEALTQGISTSKIFYAPKTITIPASATQPSWTVSNYEGEPSGYMTLATATILSVNTVYAQLIKEVGSANVVKMAHAMGVQSPLAAFDSIVLGSEPVTPLDMASVVATLANYGTYNKPYVISEIFNAAGKVIYSHQASPTRVLSPQVAATEIAVLQKVVTEGTGVNAAIGRPVAGKTGTGENWADAWFTGLVPQLATAVWVGYPQGEVPMTPPNTPIYVVGGSWPAMAFAAYNAAALDGTPAKVFRSAASFASRAPTNVPAAPNNNGLTSVIGMPSALAQSTLTSEGFHINVQYAPSGEYPPGYATAQVPTPQDNVARNSTITITVSNGVLTYPTLVAVPDLLGLSASAASQALAAMQLSGTCQLQVSPPPTAPSLTPNTVWEQSPTPGTQVPQGTTVNCLAEPAS